MPSNTTDFSTRSDAANVRVLPVEFEPIDSKWLEWPPLRDRESISLRRAGHQESNSRSESSKPKVHQAKQPPASVSTLWRFDDASVRSFAQTRASRLFEPRHHSERSSWWLWSLPVTLAIVACWIGYGIVRVFPGEIVRVRNWLGREEVVYGPNLAFRPWPAFSKDHLESGPLCCRIHVVPLTSDGFRPELTVCVLYANRTPEDHSSSQQTLELLATLVRSTLTMVAGELDLSSLISRQRFVCQQIQGVIEGQVITWGISLQSIEIMCVGKIGMSSARKILQTQQTGLSTRKRGTLMSSDADVCAIDGTMSTELRGATEVSSDATGHSASGVC